MNSIAPHFELGQDSVLRCLAFSAEPWVDHGFGTRQSQQWEQANAPVTLRQIHSASVLLADELNDRQCEGDAIITQQVRKRIGVRTADCVPILVMDPLTRGVAAIHAGWRGTAARIASNTVRQMSENFGSQAKAMQVAIGPCIRKCCYEVGRDVALQFTSIDESLEGDIGAASKVHLDLAELNRRVLMDAGVNDARIYDCGLCTFCDPELFYSYRREPMDPGRLMSALSRLE